MKKINTEKRNKGMEKIESWTWNRNILKSEEEECHEHEEKILYKQEIE